MQSLPFGTEQSAIQLRWYQEEAEQALWLGMRTESPCVVLPTGCHEAGHPILMADGTVRPVESIAVGESVMGPDSLPRRVLALCRGVGEMFRITPVKGEPFIVNGDHILYLTCTSEGSKQAKPSPSHKHGGEVDCISVYDYLKKSKSWKHLRKLKYADAISVPTSCRRDSLFLNKEREIPPYIVGLMLGDGYMDKHISLCTADEECVEEFSKFASRYGWGIHCQAKPNNKASSYRIQSHTRGKTCTAREMFARAGLLGKVGEMKAVPSSYLLSSIEDRRELLAGLIDSDGHHDGHGGFDFINKSETLSRQVVFASRSIGLRSTIREAWKASQVSEKSKYWRVHISGHTNAIPCRLKRKQTKPREQIKSSQVTGFTVEKLPNEPQPFFGFTLSGDHLYVDGNFLIHHNSGKSLVIAAVLRRVLAFNGRAMVLQPSKELIQQNADECRALMPGIDVGLYSAGLGKRHTDHDIVFAGIQSCYDKSHLFGRRDVCLIDEAHGCPPDGEGRFRTFFKGMKELCPHMRIGGLTATPFRTGTGALCGPDNLLTKVVFSASVSRLMDEGFLCRIVNKPMQSELDTSGLKIVSRTHEFDAGQAESLFNEDGNVNAAVDEILEKAAGRKSILVFCSGVKHAEHVADRLASVSGEQVGLVTGNTLALERANTIQRFKSGQLRWICNVDVLTTGFNVKQVDCICMLRATASPGLFAQIVGRGFRVHPDKQDCIAEGQNVLTDHGLVPIERVTLDMKVWDGCSYVSHCGIVFRGEQNVITYAGLTATEDHNVWTEKGWMSFREAHDSQARICVTGDGRQEIRESDNRWRQDISYRTRQGGCIGAMRQMSPRGLKRLQPSQKVISWMQKMRTERQRQQTVSGGSALVAHEVYLSQVAMHEPQRSKLEQLRRPGDSIQFLQPQPNGEMDSRQPWIRPLTPNRPHQQRQSLRAWQSAISESVDQYEQSTAIICDETNAPISVQASRDSIRRLNVNESLFSENVVFSGDRTISQKIQQTKRRVWDILNAGPRHRFTCEGLLVSNCLVCDFGENVKRHGPIDSPDYGIPSEKPKKETANAGMPQKECPACFEAIPISATKCPECGFEYPPKPKHEANADTESAILQSQVEPTIYSVESASFHRHMGRDGKQDTLRVDYQCQLASGGGNLTSKTVSTWHCPEHEGFPRKSFVKWWKLHSIADTPETIDDALSLWKRGALRCASQISVIPEGRWTKVVDLVFEDDVPESWHEEALECDPWDIETAEISYF